MTVQASATWVDGGSFDRRAFLARTGLLVVAISTPPLLHPGLARATANVYPIGPASINPDELDSWVAVAGDGTVTIYTGKEELGQGVATATLQVAADELDVPFSAVRLVQCDTWYTVDQSYSSGSQSLFTEFGPAGVRQACAAARLALVQMAAKSLGVSVSNLQVSNGVVSEIGNPTASVSYAALIGGKKFNLLESSQAVPRPFSQYRIVGTSVPRVDIPAKVTGEFTYNQDIRLPGMLWGAVVRPPTLDSTLISVDGFPGGSEPADLVRVFVKHNYVAVVSKTEWGAIAAAKLLRVRWNTAPLLPSDDGIYGELVNLSPTADSLLVDTGNVPQTLAQAAKQLTATYYYPVQMHGSMGPSSSTASVEGDTATVWTASQGVYQVRGALATALGLPAQNIRVIYVEASGCYGLNGADDASLDAAVLSQTVGRPVKVQYSRADENKWENFGQPFVITLSGGLDTKNKISAWNYEGWTATRGGRPGPPANVATGILLGFPETPLVPSQPTSPREKSNVVDNSNTVPSYIIPSQRVLSHSGTLPLLAGPLRSPARIQNTFANESFMDELAHAAGEDPINFRLNHLQDPRLIAVIQTAATLASWEYRPSATQIGSGRVRSGRGIAAMWYEGASGYAAVVAQSSVDTKTGKVTVDHLYTAQDCGPVVNPDGMKQQTEGCAIQGTSRALIEEVTWTRNGIGSVDWVTYPVLRFNTLPGAFDFKAINRPLEPVVGAGETSLTAVPAAIANSIFDATGIRMRQIPFTPARVREALLA